MGSFPRCKDTFIENSVEREFHSAKSDESAQTVKNDVWEIQDRSQRVLHKYFQWLSHRIILSHL